MLRFFGFKRFQFRSNWLNFAQFRSRQKCKNETETETLKNQYLMDCFNPGTKKKKRGVELNHAQQHSAQQHSA
jgi:hypothetical protein